MTPRLLVGWWHHSPREGSEAKEKVWRKRWGRQSPMNISDNRAFWVLLGTQGAGQA